MFINEDRGSGRRAGRFGAAMVIAGLLGLTPVAAQDDASSEVLARVGQTEITQADLDLATEMFGEQLAQVPEDQRRTVLIDALIDMHVVADAARAEGIDESDLHKQRLDFLENQALRTAYIEQNVQDAVTEEELRARYEKDVAGFTPPEEVNAAHILVETEEEAKAILEQLAAGGDFAAIAKEKSIDPGSGQNGGDLGFFGKGQMVPEFEKEAFALEPGTTSSEPVKTQFGYHILKVIEKRTQPVPTFEQVREQILPVVQREKFQKVMADLKAAADVERFDAAATDEGAGEAEDDAGDAEDGDAEDGEASEDDAAPAPAPAQ